MSADFEQAVREILDRVDLVKLVSEYVQLSRRGATWWGLCPFHSEKTPSFSVNPKKGFYYCFGCQSGGNAISFLKQVDGLSGRETILRLAAEVGVELPDSAAADPAEEAAAKERSGIMHALAVAQEYFVSVLYGADGGEARQYLMGRGIDPETATLFGLGYGGDGEGLSRALVSRGVSTKMAEAAGLISPKKFGSGWYERFRGRVICPVYSNEGAPIAFSARILSASDEGPKYMNSPETLVFRKSNSVFGLYQAKQAIRQAHRVILVEGNFDVISLAAAGIRNVVAPLGTALTSSQVRQMSRFTDRVTVFFDGDEAGFKASRRAVGILVEEGVDGSVVVAPAGEDPDSIVTAGGRVAVEAAVERAKPMVSWLVDSLVSVHGRTPHGIRAVVQDVTEVLSGEKDRIRSGLYREEIARILGIDVRELKAVMGNPTSRACRPEGDEQPKAEVTMLKLLLLDSCLIDTLLEKGGRELFTSAETRALLQEMIDLVLDGKEPDREMVTGAVEAGTTKASVLSVLAEPLTYPDPLKAFDETFFELRIAFLNRRICELNREMCETVEDDEKLRLLQEVSTIEKELKNTGPSQWRFRGAL